MLSDKEFSNIIELTPLVSIDFIIKYNDMFLLGKRNNEPAKNYYFVPGGRIFKNEKLEEACKRLSKKELGIIINFNQLEFLTNTQHIYNNNVFDNNFNTHYVCLAYIYQLKEEEYNKICFDDQHSELLWLSKHEILNNKKVHINTINYINLLE